MLLAKAWDEALAHEKLGDTMAYWKDRLTVKSSTQRRDASENRKRKSGASDNYSYQYTNENADDDEEPSLFAQPDQSPERRMKQEFLDPMSSSDIAALYDDTDHPSPANSLNSNKRMKLGDPAPSSIHPHGISQGNAPGKQGPPKSLLSDTLRSANLQVKFEDLR